MIKVGLTKDLFRVLNVPNEVIEVLNKVTYVLEENYGADRDIDKDMGGYILLFEENDDIKLLYEELYMDINADAIPEFVDFIKCSDGQTFTHTLILCNNDFGISIFMPLEITPDNLKEYIIE